MLSYLYAFNPCISISEDGRYLSHSNVEQYESRHLMMIPRMEKESQNQVILDIFPKIII